MPDDPGSAEDRWLLSPAEQALVATKNRANRLGVAVLLISVSMADFRAMRPRSKRKGSPR